MTYEKEGTVATHDKDYDNLRDDLLTVFAKYKVEVAVGLTRSGIAIRSQDERVDAQNVGEVNAR